MGTVRHKERNLDWKTNEIFNYIVGRIFNTKLRRSGKDSNNGMEKRWVFKNCDTKIHTRHMKKVDFYGMK